MTRRIEAGGLRACGKPLHYARPATRAIVERLVAGLGPTMRVKAAGRAWAVPRHYLALHGLRAAELPRMGFAELPVPAASGGGR